MPPAAHVLLNSYWRILTAPATVLPSVHMNLRCSLGGPKSYLGWALPAVGLSEAPLQQPEVTASPAGYHLHMLEHPGLRCPCLYRTESKLTLTYECITVASHCAALEHAA